MTKERLAWGLLSAAVILCFLQALRVLFSTLFGFIYDQVIEGPITAWLGLGVAFVVIAFYLPAIWKRPGSIRMILLSASLVLAVRPVLSVNDIWVRYWGALGVVAFGGIFLVAVLAQDRILFWRSFLWALVVEQLLRVIGFSTDISLEASALVWLIAFSLGMVVVCVWLWRAKVEMEGSAGSLSWAGAIALGSFLFLETSLLALPHAISRWAVIPYAAPALALLIVTFLPLFSRLTSELLTSLQRTSSRIALVFLLFAGILYGYFFSGWGPGVGLMISQFAAVISFVLIIEMDQSHVERLGIKFAAGMLFFLLLNFFNAFAFTYPYTLPMLREMGWIGYVIASLCVAWAVLMTKPQEPMVISASLPAPSLGVILLVCLVLSLVIVWPQDPQPRSKDQLRLATYNIHYGYDDDWHTTLPALAETIAEADVDVIALQEVDTGRMTSYSADNAYYLARKLGMVAHYLPTVEHLTGIALLHRGEPGSVDTLLLPSLQEQTGIIHAELEGDSRPLHAYATWLGLEDEDTMTQVQAALAWIGDSNPASFGGDFNASPDSEEVAAVRAAGFADPFELLGIDPAPPTSPAIDPISRIDYVWVRDLLPVRAWVSDSLASDHRMVVIEIAIP